MQTPEEYLRQRSQPPPSSASSASQIAVFVASFAAVCVALYFAQTPPADDTGAAIVEQRDEVAALSDADLIKAVESFLKAGDPAISSALKAIADFSEKRSEPELRPIPDDISSTLSDLARLIEPYAESLTLQRSTLDSLKSVQAQAASIQQAFSNKKSELAGASPQLLADLNDLKQRQAAIDAAVVQLSDAERIQTELGAELQRRQARVSELERTAETSSKAWRQYVEQKLKPLMETVGYSADRLAQRLQEAKSSSGRVSVLRRELQTHSVILTESATKIAALTHQKTILESRLKSIDQLGHDLQRKFSTNTDVSLQSAIAKQSLRLETVRSEYGSLPDEPARASTKAVEIGADQASTELPGYKKKLMQIAVDDAERKLAWLQELQAISKQHGQEDSGSDDVKEEALRSFIDLKKSEIANELASTVAEIESERTWQERIVTELNDKNEQLKVLERDMSSDAIGELRAQAERAKAAHRDAEAESKTLENAYLQASHKLQDAQAESSALSERLMAHKEKVRRLHESHTGLIRAADTLRQRVANSARASRAAMQEVAQIRARSQQLRVAFDALAGQYADADRRRRAQEGQVRAQLAGLCRVVE